MKKHHESTFRSHSFNEDIDEKIRNLQKIKEELEKVKNNDNILFLDVE